MKIAISSEGKTLGSMIDERFGRCRYFIIAEMTGNKLVGFKSIENKGAEESHGAGPKAAEQLGEQDVEAVITGSVGPNATDILGQLGIKPYHAEGTVKGAIENLRGLKEITVPGDRHPPVHEAPSAQADTEKSAERIFFPILDNNGKDSEISSHFGHAPFFGLYDTETKEFTIKENSLDHVNPNRSPVDQIVEAVNPTTVYAQGIGERAIGLFDKRGIMLRTGPYRTVREAIDNLDKLEGLDGGCGHEHHEHHHRGVSGIDE